MVRVSMAQRARQDRDDVRVGVLMGGGGLLFLQDCTAFRTPKNHPPTPFSLHQPLPLLLDLFFFTGRSYRALRYRASVLKMAMNIWQLRGD